MDKHTAYILLFAELNTLRGLPPDLLIARVGVAQSRTLLVQDQPLEIQTTLDWADRHRTTVRITARAFGSGHWHTERLEESVVVTVVSET
ncbi:hypothetical protein [Tahibacter harae]|uniref:Uncharacterized protein n=1 Tax=Tahibacter harae TaxID=2963937 RepID=A0ABT1QWK7_9GAMM|nr:hypothetical protein [Tahibacter harae]MCQ4166677.1 hypothetical protein [Tahibacter harae]